MEFLILVCFILWWFDSRALLYLHHTYYIDITSEENGWNMVVGSVGIGVGVGECEWESEWGSEEESE